jgi:hypothetical protein
MVLVLTILYPDRGNESRNIANIMIELRKTKPKMKM